MNNLICDIWGYISTNYASMETHKDVSLRNHQKSIHSHVKPVRNQNCRKNNKNQLIYHLSNRYLAVKAIRNVENNYHFNDV